MGADRPMGSAVAEAAARAQEAAQLAGAAPVPEVLTMIARRAVEGSRAVSCGISVMDEENKLASAGAYGPAGDHVIAAMAAGPVTLSLTWENKVIGVFAAVLPPGLAGPDEEELAFYSALAGQASVAAGNARLTTRARQGAILLERARLARDLHDSVSQALFAITMHARGAQLAMTRAGLDEDGPLGRSLVQLAELSRAALAQARALADVLAGI
jgi:signal transduction histidine kinase